METIQLRKPQWEAIAVLVGTGIVEAEAYARHYPNCGTPGMSYRRLIKVHPEVLARVNQIRNAVMERAIDRGAMTTADVQAAYLENIEHAKKFGKVISRDRNGQAIEFERNHGAINQALAGIANVNGLSLAQAKKKRRGEDDPEAERTPDEVLRSIYRLVAETQGMTLDELTKSTLKQLAIGATDRVGEGDRGEVQGEAPALRSIPETETLP